MFKQLHLMHLTTLLVALIATPVYANTQLDDKMAIEGLIKNFSTHWHDSDAHGLAMFWRADGDFINPAGMMLKGREQIEAFYSQAFKMGYAGSTVDTTIDQLRFLTPDLALVDGEFTINGASMGDHKERPAEHGYFTVIAERTSGQWMVVSNREMEPLAPAQSAAAPST